MKTILDLETELGRCDLSGLDLTPGRANVWAVCVHTNATCLPWGAQAILKLEHRCFLRAGRDITPQPWVEPVTRVETVPPNEEDMLAAALAAHEVFSEQIPALLPVPLETPLPAA
jgi:hypothetical protein